MSVDESFVFEHCDITYDGTSIRRSDKRVCGNLQNGVGESNYLSLADDLIIRKRKKRKGSLNLKVSKFSLLRSLCTMVCSQLSFI